MSNSSVLDARRRLCGAVLVSFFVSLVELLGGLISNSLAIIADAAHDAIDGVGFVLSLIFLWLAHRSSSKHFSFGSKRAEVLGAVASVLLIWMITGGIVYESIVRIQQITSRDPAYRLIDGSLMFGLSFFGLLCNILITAILGHGHSHLLGGHGHSHEGASHGHSHIHSNSSHGHSHEGASHGHSHSNSSHGHSHEGGSHGHSHSNSSHGHSHEGGSHGHSHSNSSHGHSHEGGSHGHSHEDGSHGHSHGQEGTSRDHTDSENSHGHSHEEGSHDHSHAGGSHDHSHAGGSHDHSHAGGSHGHSNGPEIDSSAHKHGREASSDHSNTGSSHSENASSDEAAVSNNNLTRIARHGHGHGESGDHEEEEEGNDLQEENVASHGHSHEENYHSENTPVVDINVSSAYAHAIGHVLQDLGVIVASILIWIFQTEYLWQLADPICTILFSLLGLVPTIPVLGTAFRILMQGIPSGVDILTIKKTIEEEVEGVDSCHELHMWSLSVNDHFFSAHIVISQDVMESVSITRKVRSVLLTQHGISHAAIQVEAVGQECIDLREGDGKCYSYREAENETAVLVQRSCASKLGFALLKVGDWFRKNRHS